MVRIINKGGHGRILFILMAKWAVIQATERQIMETERRILDNQYVNDIANNVFSCGWIFGMMKIDNRPLYHAICFIPVVSNMVSR